MASRVNRPCRTGGDKPRPYVRGIAALVAIVALGAPLLADDWHGQGRASGVVLDVDKRPLSGATVTLRLGDDVHGPAPATTDARGRWSLLGLAPGRWRLTVEANGFVHADGFVDVPEEGPGRALTVQLRPLDEVPPGGTENPQSVILWLDKGNSLLAQGHPADARTWYEKALAVLPPQQKPDVLQAVARTWFLQGEKERAVSPVKQGLAIAPQHAVLRQLLHMLLEDLGRGAEADAFLSALPGVPPVEATHPPEEEAEAAELPPELAAALAAPAEPPRADRRGAYKVRFAERSPWSEKREIFRRAGTPPAAVLQQVPQALAYDLAAESFQVFVPEVEPAASGWGLIVWVSPGPFGGTLRPEMHAQLARHRLIWVGANASGNDRVRWDRWGLALDAVWHLQKLYRIDPERVYVAGYSGGGRAASALTMLYPDVFRAGLMVMGVDWYRDLPIPDRPGAHWPAVFEKPPRELHRLAQERRFVLLTGERDFNRQQTRVIRGELEKEGFQAVTYLEVPGMSHYDAVPAEWLAQAFAALDPGSSIARRG